MHRIDTATAQVDKFGPGKNGFTNGDPATGRRATDLNSDMWDAVQEEICTVIESSGLALNKEEHDQLYEAIIKIITSKIPDALLKKNNLSDLADKAIARTNLQLKSAATKDVTTSSHDVTAGRVLKVGDYGLGVSNGSVKSLASIYDITCSGEYNAMGSGTTSPTTGIPADSGNTRFAVYAGNIYSNQYLVTLTSNVHFYVGLVNTANKTATWSKFYNTFNKPSAPDVDAVSASNGGVFNKFVRFNKGLTLRGSKVGDAGMVGINFGADDASFNGANLLLQSWYGIGFYSSFPADAPRGIMGYIDVRMGRLEMKEQIIPGNYTNFDNRYQAKGNYTPAGQAYTKTESDGRFQPKGSYTPAGEAYTKAQSDARYLQGIRVSATQVREFRDGGGYSSNDAAFATAIAMVGGSSNVGSLLARYLQRNINGTWVNVAT
ncbi:tail fiber protein [Citrobacter sp. CK183]|uniref:tail fiber protein n=1 Tax=Citrobacter sp. CK183 TaxID=2985092 RepID=UPI002577F4B6|nr:tail fiber protein [Citrobacter sp. CK183]MDM3051004.1 tail fiber protein [Citrobacter sp. CK183]